MREILVDDDTGWLLDGADGGARSVIIMAPFLWVLILHAIVSGGLLASVSIHLP